MLMIDRLVQELFEEGCIKFGEFKLKSGIISPIYADFRILPSNPRLLKRVGKLLADEIEKVEWFGKREFDLVAGIPYAGIPIAAAVSFVSNRPMIYPRKEVKDYGTRQRIEGRFEAGNSVAVIDDVITDGRSKIKEAIEPLGEAGLVVTDVFIILDREQGGKEILANEGCNLRSLLTLSHVLDVLVSDGQVSVEMAANTRDFIAANQFTSCSSSI